MRNKFNSIFKEVLIRVNPSKDELQLIQRSLKDFLKKIENKIKTNKVNAEVFVGGSFAKKTLIKKDCYDIDIFLRFNAKYKDEEISSMANNILKGIGDIDVLHGSRDYFKIKAGSSLYFEIVPVRKIKKPEEAVNVTDLSYAHVRYINNKAKSKNILDEIRIAKAFCHANNCYGAESYVGGFSGYALELLIYYYNGFINFLKAIADVNLKNKLIIDIEKHYKNKHQIMVDINSSKLQSPIILIDPTYKQRNALAALSEETFEKFKKDAANFLKNPSKKAFEQKKMNLEKIKKDAKKKKYEFILIEVKTNRQPGDIAGSKLLKFYRHLIEELNMFFEVKNKGFNYNKEKTARYFFVTKSKGEIIIEGPDARDKLNVLKFKKKHRNIFTNKKKAYAKEKINFSAKQFIEKWKEKSSEKLNDMYIESLKVEG